jgi:hypothetical protein
MAVENAKISGTMLGNEDHGIFTAMLYLDFGGSGQGFGGYGLDAWQQEESYRRDITGAGTEFIKQILYIVGVDKWEDLKGKYVRVKREDDNWSSPIIAIGNIIEDKWFTPKEWFKQNGYSE